jgi:hypothetical protein
MLITFVGDDKFSSVSEERSAWSILGVGLYVTHPLNAKYKGELYL